MVNVTFLCANRPTLLKQALDSIGDLSDATVTIRDAGMNPEVGVIARGFGGANSAYILGAEPVGTGPARNLVIRASEYFFGRGDYLYLSDDDVYFHVGWMQSLVNAYEEAWEHGFRVIGGVGHPYHHPCAPATVLPSGLVVNEVYAQPLQSMLMRWEVWDKYGPFCETPAGKVCQSEDADFCNKIRDDGFKVGVVAPALLVNCGITNSFGEHIPGWEMVKAQAPAGVIVE